MARFIIDPGSSPLGRDRALAAANLEWAVPQVIEEMRSMPAAERELAASCFTLDAGTWVALRAHRDSAGLTILARGLAAMAYRPGGVAYLGMRWRAEAAPGAGRAEAA